MQGKPKRQTRERILICALERFNDVGEPAVSTTTIAAETGISQGNLYYHFRSKEAIVEALLGEFEQQIDPLLDAMGPAREAEDLWLCLHLLFEAIWKYRFFYYDIGGLMGHHPRLARRFSNLLARKQQTAAVLCRTLGEAGLLQADGERLEALATNIALVGTFWISYQRALHPKQQADIALGVYQVMQLVSPWLRPDVRTHLDALAIHYQHRH